MCSFLEVDRLGNGSDERLLAAVSLLLFTTKNAQDPFNGYYVDAIRAWRDRGLAQAPIQPPKKVAFGEFKVT